MTKKQTVSQQRPSNLFPITSTTSRRTEVANVNEPVPGSPEYIRLLGEVEGILTSEKNEDENYMYDMLSVCMTEERVLDFS